MRNADGASVTLRAQAYPDVTQARRALSQQACPGRREVNTAGFVIANATGATCQGPESASAWLEWNSIGLRIKVTGHQTSRDALRTALRVAQQNLPLDRFVS